MDHISRQSLLDSLSLAIQAQSPLPLDNAEALLSTYPYLAQAAASAAANPQISDSQRRRLLAAATLNAPADSSITSSMAAGFDQAALFAAFYPADNTPVTPSTEAALDTFLDNYGKIDPREEALLERLIFNPVADYSQILAKEQADSHPTPSKSATTSAQSSSQDAMLDAFLAAQTNSQQQRTPAPTPSPDQPVPAFPRPDASAPLSESLAIIYIKKKRYSKAYEIIHQLSLNFPEKSVYFADQLRFLRKLMLLEQHNELQKANGKK